MGIAEHYSIDAPRRRPSGGVFLCKYGYSLSVCVVRLQPVTSCWASRPIGGRTLKPLPQTTPQVPAVKAMVNAPRLPATVEPECQAAYQSTAK